LKAMSGIAPRGNHGPMAAEALVNLGRADHLPVFVKSFLNQFSSRFPPHKAIIERSNWKEAFGDPARTSDWVRFFEKEIEADGWKNVVHNWIADLAPGLSAAAAHGIIRTGHAVRSLRENESKVRRKELAQALAYWASYYQTIHSSGKKENLKLKLSNAVEMIPVLPPDKFVHRGNIMEMLRNLNDFSAFADVTNFIEIEGEAKILLSSLTQEFVKVYLEKVNGRNLIILIHIITALASVRSLIPVISKGTSQELLFFGWQAAAGLSSISGDNKNQISVDQKVNKKDLIEKAVLSNEVHAIKFTEACLREYKLNPKPVYLLAAKDAVDRLT